jgi:hypothetical protein
VLSLQGELNMPTVPKFQRRATVDSKLNLPGSTALNLPDISGNINQAFNAGINSIGKVSAAVEKQQIKADRIAVAKAKNEYDAKMNATFNDPENGILNKRGEDAMNTPDFYDKRRKEVYEGTQSKLNDAQKQEFELYAQRQDTGHKNTLNRHVSGESDKLFIGTTKARINLLQEKAVQNAYSPKEIAKSLQEQNLEIFKMADTMGMSKEQTEAAILESNSKTHTSILNTMITKGDDLVAKNYFGAVKASMNAQDKLRIEKTLEVSSTLGESQRLTQEMMDKDISPDEAVKQIREKTKDDPKLQEVAVAKYKQRFTEQRQFKQYRDNDIYADLFNKVREGASVDQLPKEVLASLEPSKQKSILDFATKPVRKNSDLTKFNDWKVLAYDKSTRDKFLETDVSKFTAHLTPSDAKAMINLQVKLRNEEVDEDEASGFLSQTGLVNQSLSEVGITDKKPKAKFNNFVQNEVVKWSQENNKPGNKIPDAEFQKIIDKGLIKGEVIGGGFLHDPNKRFFEAEGDEEFAKFAADDDSEDALVAKQREIAKLKVDLRNMLKKANRDFTEEYIDRAVREVISKK